MTYPVKQDWIPQLPQIAYRNGVGYYEGVVLHYTDNPNDSAAGERVFEGNTYQSAFVHEFIDPNEIIQVANPQYIAYGAGHYANQRFIHLELCTAHNQADFDKSFDMWCERAAIYLHNMGLGVHPAQSDGTGTLWSHANVTQYLGGTTHMDPIDYLKQWGLTWDDAVKRVGDKYMALDKKTSFPDVEAGRWSENAIAVMVKNGFMNGYEDGTFRPTQPITREELASVLNNVVYYINQK